MIYLQLFLFLFFISTCVFSQPEHGSDSKNCFASHRGVLKYHPKNNQNEMFNVSAVLNKDTLQLYRGFDNFDTVNLRNVITPLSITSTNTECLTMNILNKDIIELCCTSEECINYWWFLITKQIMCINQGDMRHEVNDGLTLEEEQQQKLLGENTDDITIHIKDEFGNIPDVLIKSN